MVFSYHLGSNRPPSMLAIVAACRVLIPAYVFFKFRFTEHLVVARRFVFNRSVIVASSLCAPNLLSSFSFIHLYMPLYSFVIPTCVYVHPCFVCTHFITSSTSRSLVAHQFEQLLADADHSVHSVWRPRLGVDARHTLG